MSQTDFWLQTLVFWQISKLTQKISHQTIWAALHIPFIAFLAISERKLFLHQIILQCRSNVELFVSIFIFYLDF